MSNDLHQYFVREMRMTNYAARQAEIFRLIQIAEVSFITFKNISTLEIFQYIVRDKKQLITANQIFNFVEHDFRFATSL